jgi:predicted acyl esterase
LPSPTSAPPRCSLQVPHPPSLKAIFPEVAWLDTYTSFYPGGIFKLWPVYNWSNFVRTADLVAPLPAD